MRGQQCSWSLNTGDLHVCNSMKQVDQKFNLFVFPHMYMIIGSVLH